MTDYNDPAISYAYEIEKTVEIHLASNRVFRLEIQRAVKEYNKVHYRVAYYERQSLYRTIEGKKPGDLRPDNQLYDQIEYHVWVEDTSLPWVNQETAEAALARDIALLIEGRNEENVYL